MERESVKTAFDASLNHKIDMLCLAIMFVGFFSCLIRSDYNFVLVFFCYFVWQQRKDLLTLKLIMGTLIILMIFDFIFIFTELRVWGQTDEKNEIWTAIKSMHGFGIFCFVVINLLKIGLMVFIGKGISEKNKAVQIR